MAAMAPSGRGRRSSSATGPAVGAAATVDPILASAAANDVDGLAEAVKAAGGDGGAEATSVLMRVRDGDGRTALHAAAKVGAKEVVVWSLDQGVDVNMTTPKGLTPLHFAAFGGHMGLVEFLVERGANPKLVDGNGRNALHLATVRGHMSIVEWLAAPPRSVELDALAAENMSAVHFASVGGHAELLKWLLDNGPQGLVRVASVGGTNALHHACANGRLECAKLLRDAGLALGAQDEHGRVALHFAVAGDHHEVTLWLIENNCDPLLKDDDGRSPLDLATMAAHKAQSSNSPSFKYLQNATRPPAAPSAPVLLTSSQTAVRVEWKNPVVGPGAPPLLELELQWGLRWSVLSGWNKVPRSPEDLSNKALISDLEPETSYVVRVRAKNKNGWSPFGPASDGMVTAAMGETPAPASSSKATPPPSPSPPAGAGGRDAEVPAASSSPVGGGLSKQSVSGAFMAACKDGNVADLVRLKQAGADVTVCAKDGRTGMHQAALGGHVHAGKWLVESGVAIDSSDKMGGTPVLLAIVSGHARFVKWAYSKGASLSSTDLSGYGAVHYAVLNKLPDMLVFLLEEGCNPYLAAKDGKTPADVVGDSECDRILELALGPPPIPEPPILVAAMRNGLRVEWRPTKSLKSCPVLGYELQYGKKYSLFWESASDSIPGDKLTWSITSLAPDTKWALKLRAKNKHGWGPFSARSEDMSTLAPDQMPVPAQPSASSAPPSKSSSKPTDVSAPSAAKPSVFRFANADREELSAIAAQTAKSAVERAVHRLQSSSQQLVEARWSAVLRAVLNAPKEDVAALPDVVETAEAIADRCTWLLGASDLPSNLRHWAAIATLRALSVRGLVTVLQPIIAGEGQAAPTSGGSGAGDTNKSGSLGALLASQTPPAYLDADCRSAVHVATVAGHLPLLRLLRDNGADLERRTASGAHILHLAAFGGHADVVSWAQDSKSATVDILDANGWKPFHYACLGGSLSTCKVLNGLGGSMTDADSAGRAPMHFAAMGGHVTVVEWLRDSGAPVGVIDKAGATPLHFATLGGHTDAATFLMRSGISPISRDATGMSAAKLATEHLSPDHALHQMMTAHMDLPSVARPMMTVGKAATSVDVTVRAGTAGIGTCAPLEFEVVVGPKWSAVWVTLEDHLGRTAALAGRKCIRPGMTSVVVPAALSAEHQHQLIVVDGMLPGRELKCRVRAGNANGWGAWSQDAAVTQSD